MNAKRGSVMFIVIWALSIGALVLSSVQLFGYRHAMLGRDSLGRIQARWAARGGLEYAIAVMADHTQEPVPDNAFAMVRDLDDVAVGDLATGSYDIRHHADGIDWWGPMDAHSKFNINAALDNPGLLTAVFELPPDIVDAMLDWVDEDEDERPLGAEQHYYQSLSMPYQPRNAPMRSISELELVAGVWPEHLRGEDWNLNNRLDANEDDGERTWPDDNPDGVLEAEFSGFLTTYSRNGGLTASGLPRIDLSNAEAIDVAERLDISEELAGEIISYAGGNASLEQLLVRQLSVSAPPDDAQGGQQQQQSQSGPVLTNDQLRAVLDETMANADDIGGPGKLNINTVSEDLLLKLLVNQEHLADEILYLRSSRPEGITSLVELLDIPAFRDEPSTIEFLAGLMDTRSAVYCVSSKGRSPGGVEVEINAVVDRSTVPVRILEYRE